VGQEGSGGAAPGGNSTRRTILFALRRHGPLAPDELVARLGVSRTAVLQQLHALEAGGLVERSAVRHGVGRPRHLYDATADAQALFPASYDRLARGLIDAIGRVGGETLVEEVFHARCALLADQIHERLARNGLADAPLAERVRELAAIQDELGYLCTAETATATSGDVTPNGTIRLREHNCAIHAVATRYPAACACELDLFRHVLGAKVVRETHIAAGDRSCTYRIEERPAERRRRLAVALPVVEAPGR